MIFDPEFVLYACIARRQQISLETMILAEFNSADSSLRDKANQCLNCAPPNHIVFSHTHLNKAYTFVLYDPFIYFGIFDSKMSKSDRFRFLNRLIEALDPLVVKGGENYAFSSYCLQGEIHPIFRKLLSKSLDFDGLVQNGGDKSKIEQPPISGSRKGRKIFSLGGKKRLNDDVKIMDKEIIMNGKNEVNSSNNNHNNNVVSLVDDGGAIGKQKAKKIWRRHVWVVLILDLAICLILFGIWIFVCQGFQCIEA